MRFIWFEGFFFFNFLSIFNRAEQTMSLEKDFIVHDTHTKLITALGCSPARREIYLGFEDGVVKG